ncbi:MAG: HAMP domain-containing histidine kinase [Clostridia bacterium]|nr:HAMP domain-containing histidine kinase [Clostridia bacterium]
MFKTVFIKYLTTFLLINLVCLLILAFVTGSLVDRYNTNYKKTTLENASEYISEYMYDRMKLTQITDDMRAYVGIYAKTLREFLGLMSVNVDDFVTFISDENGQLILAGGSELADEYGLDGDGFEGPDGGKIVLPKEHLANLKNNEKTSEISDLGGIFDSDFIILSTPIFSPQGRYSGAIVTATSKAGMNNLLDGVVRTTVMVTIGILVAMLAAVYFTTRRLVAPLREMSSAAKNFAAGRFDVRVPVRGNDEVAKLAGAFNNMAASLESNDEMRRLFLANVSHDLRTPMTTISGFIDGILDGAIPPEKQDYYLGIIASEVRRLSRLVSSLLDITRIQAGERKFTMTSFDICEMCREVLISSEQRIEEKHLDVEFIADEDNMYAIGDTDAIHQIVYNLMDNAIKFSRDGGKYTVRITERSGRIETSVFNEGDGISQDDLPYVFDRFYKSDRSRGLDKTGVGLGLYIAKTIMDQHNGTITAESEYGKWCRFTFSLEKGTSTRN